MPPSTDWERESGLGMCRERIALPLTSKLVLFGLTRITVMTQALHGE